MSDCGRLLAVGVRAQVAEPVLGDADPDVRGQRLLVQVDVGDLAGATPAIFRSPPSCMPKALSISTQYCGSLDLRSGRPSAENATTTPTRQTKIDAMTTGFIRRGAGSLGQLLVEVAVVVGRRL